MIHEQITSLFNKYNIPFKETDEEISSILCPFCLNEGKKKRKLYINKESYKWHCFVCNSKGSIYSLYKIFNLFSISEMQSILDNYMVDKLFSYEEDNKFVKNTYEDFLSDSEIEIFKSKMKSDRNKTKEELENFSITHNLYAKDIVNSIKKYIQSRSVEPMALNLLNIPHYYGIKDLLEYRFIVPSFYGTNYEARSILDKKNPRYLKRSSTNPDYVFLHRDNDFFPLNRTSKNTVIENLYVVEGLFDCTKLFLYGLDSCSMSGWGNSINVMFFLKSLYKLNNIKVNNVIFIFDKDLDNSKLEEVCNKLSFDFSKYYNMSFYKFSYKDYKDIGSIEIADMPVYINNLIKLTQYGKET